MAKILYMKDGEQDGTSRIAVDDMVIDSKNFVGLVADNIHAIQWNGTTGEIEYNDGKKMKK